LAKDRVVKLDKLLIKGKDSFSASTPSTTLFKNKILCEEENVDNSHRARKFKESKYS
jgi:hypothetical protein